MKLLILGSGQSYHATRWANALSDLGLSVVFVTQHDVVRFLNSRVKVERLPWSGKAGYILNRSALRQILREYRPNILHAHYASGYGCLARLAGYSPLIISVYGAEIFDFPRKSIWHKKALSWILSGADEVLSTSEVMADQVTKLYPNMLRPIVTPFGVDTTAFCNVGLAEGDSSKYFHIGIVKKLERKYGIDILISATKFFVDQINTDIHVSIIGEGSELSNLKAQVESLGLSRQVDFKGVVQNNKVPGLLRTFDVFVVPSRYDSESFGVAAVEAMACEVPVVVSNVGGLPEVVIDKSTGIVVPKEDPHALFVALVELYNDPKLRLKLGSAGRQRVLEHYDWKNNVAKMKALYKQPR